MTSNINLLLLMVLWVDWGSSGHLSFGVSHMVVARYELDFRHPKDQLGWMFSMAGS